MKLRYKILVGLLVVGVGFTAFARHLDLEYRSLIASTSKGEPLFSAKQLADYSAQVITHLQDANVEVAIISRAGQPRVRLPDGIAYTHSAFWVRNDAGGYDVYNLYHGEENRRISSLVTDKASDFLRTARAHDIGILIPKPDVQTRLAAHIKSANYARVHQANYSMISNPFDTRYQNCNEFMLDVLASFAWNEYDPQVLKNRLRVTLEPTEIKANLVRRYIAPLVDERLVMEDHEKKIMTVTRLDLKEFLQSQDMLADAYVLELG